LQVAGGLAKKRREKKSEKVKTEKKRNERKRRKGKDQEDKHRELPSKGGDKDFLDCKKTSPDTIAEGRAKGQDRSGLEE